jgi:hypothetical protein
MAIVAIAYGPERFRPLEGQALCGIGMPCQAQMKTDTSCRQQSCRYKGARQSQHGPLPSNSQKAPGFFLNAELIWISFSAVPAAAFLLRCNEFSAKSVATRGLYLNMTTVAREEVNFLKACLWLFVLLCGFRHKRANSRPFRGKPGNRSTSFTEDRASATPVRA